MYRSGFSPARWPEQDKHAQQQMMIMNLFRKGASLMAGLATALFLLPSLAFALDEQPVVGMAKPWELGLQAAASPVKHQVDAFHDMLLVIITAIALFVLALMIFVIVRFNSHTNKEPSKTSHNTVIEIIWTAVPVIILIVIAIPSFSLLYYMDKAPNAEMTIKATGYQWYWTYNYPDHNDYAVTAIMLNEDELQPGQPRLLSTDNNLVVPVETNIRLLVTAADVLHSWALPSLGVKKDAVPGRLNETWFRVDKPGMYYGQCSEICGEGHGFMPIAIQAVPKDQFDAWIAEKVAGNSAAPARTFADAADAAE
jgi:cytochrome c oxidase subunit II